MSNSFFWNLRGLNDPAKHRIFSDWLYSNRPIFGVLLETHINELSIPGLMSTLCKDWHYLSNHHSDEDGRIVLIWRDPVKVTVIAQSRQMITCELVLPNCTPIIYSAIYASNLSAERIDLWVEMMNLHTAQALDTRPWMIGGDLNQILHPHEHSSFCHSRHAPQMFQLHDCLLQMGFV